MPSQRPQPCLAGATPPREIPGTSSSVPSSPKESRAQARLRILSRSPVFGAIPLEEMERVAAVSVYRRVPRGEVVTRQDEKVISLVVIGRGSLKITRRTDDPDTEFLAGIFGEGDVIGEIGIFEGTPRIGSHIATEDSEVLLIPKADLLALLDRQPQVATALIRELCTKLRLAADLALALHSQDFPSRFYLRLLYLSGRYSRRDSDGFRIQHGLSQKELADSIATSRESLNRLMVEWKQAGFIDYGRGFILIRDPVALAAALPPAVRASGILGASAT